MLWPESYQDFIASTASKVLNAILENANRPIYPHQIRGILDCIPSCIELCEIIEGLGFKLDSKICHDSLGNNS
jgi:hypothetical protein